VYNSVLYHITSEDCASNETWNKNYSTLFFSHSCSGYITHALTSQIEQTVATNTSPPLTMGKRDAVTASSLQVGDA
jgi:hypothetical protein